MSIEYPPFFCEHLEKFLNSLRISHGFTWLLEFQALTEENVGKYGNVELMKIGDQLLLTLNGNRQLIATKPGRSSLAWANVFEMVAVALFGIQRDARGRHPLMGTAPMLDSVALLAQIIRDHPVPTPDITVAAKLQAFAEKYAQMEV